MNGGVFMEIAITDTTKAAPEKLIYNFCIEEGFFIICTP
jgi:hypothetical protein